MASSAREINVVLFMREVQKYDCLYNRYSKDYKDKYVKINCWTKIAEKFNMSPSDSEKKFKNVRTSYGRYLKKVKSVPSGSGRDAVPMTKDFAGLEWLQNHINYRPTVTNIDMPVDSPMAVNDDADSDDIDGYCERSGEPDEEKSPGLDSIELNDDSYSELPCNDRKSPLIQKPVVDKKNDRPWSTGNRKRKNSKEDVELDIALLATVNSLAEKVRKTDEPVKHDAPLPECEDTHFCKSLIPRLKRLPPRTRAIARINIEQVLFQAHFSNPTYPPVPVNSATPHPTGYYQPTQIDGGFQAPDSQYNMNREQLIHFNTE